MWIITTLVAMSVMGAIAAPVNKAAGDDSVQTLFRGQLEGLADVTSVRLVQRPFTQTVKIGESTIQNEGTLLELIAEVQAEEETTEDRVPWRLFVHAARGRPDSPMLADVTTSDGRAVLALASGGGFVLYVVDVSSEAEAVPKEVKVDESAERVIPDGAGQNLIAPPQDLQYRDLVIKSIQVAASETGFTVQLSCEDGQTIELVYDQDQKAWADVEE